MANQSVIDCSMAIPTTKELYHPPGLSVFGIVFLAISCVLIAVVIGLYIEQLSLCRSWRTSARRNTTLVLISLSPFVAFSSFLAVVVPRSGTLVDLLNQAFIAYCLEAFLQHIESYYGSVELLCKSLSGSTVSLRGPPCCCCCLCLPTVPVNSKTYNWLRALVVQSSFFRPLLMLIAAVLWTDGNYQPGVIAADGAYIYITVLNSLSTMPAIYGLIRIFVLTKEHLVKERIRAKFIHIQLTVISTVLFNLLCSILTKAGVIGCSKYLSSQGRGERIYHFILIVLMVPLCLMARFYYLPRQEGHPYVVQVDEAGTPPGDQPGIHDEADDNQVSAGNVQDNTNTQELHFPVVIT